MSHRAVFVELLRRDLSERYQGSVLGAGWWVISPLLQLAVLSIVFGALLPTRATAGDVPYPVFLALGLWPWLLFANAINRASGAYVENAGLIGKLPLPISLYVKARMASSMLIDLLGLMLVIVIVIFFCAKVSISMLPLAALGLLILIVMALALGKIVAIVQVFIRDVAVIIAQLLTLGLFLAPIMYPRDLLNPSLAKIIGMNPLTAPIEAIRIAFVPSPIAFDWRALFGSAIIAALCLLFAQWLQQRARPHIEDFL